MPSNYTGSPTGSGAGYRVNPTIPEPIGADNFSAGALNNCYTPLADFVAYLQQNALIMGQVNNVPAGVTRINGAAGSDGLIIIGATTGVGARLAGSGASATGTYSGLGAMAVGSGAIDASTTPANLGFLALGGSGGAPGAWIGNFTAATATVRQDAAKLTNADLDMSGVLNAGPTVGFTNRLSPGHIAKAWGRVNIVTGVATLAEGVNVASANTFTTGGNLIVTFATAMANANYDASASLIGVLTDSNSTVWVGITNATATGFEIFATQTNVTPNTRVALNGTFQVSFKVFGRQGT